jgi:tRNA threonylcarbamoyladenosine biosynthesis protein TsaB
MKILAFDTSTKFLSIACLEDNEVKAAFHEDVGIRHSEILIDAMKETLKKTGWSLKEIELVCTGLGPGSFTGVRIAVATVKGLAAVLRNKIVGVPTMDAIVMQAPPGQKAAAPLLDAHKGKVYTCIYDRSGGEVKRITDYLLMTVDEFLGSLDKKVVLFGDGVARYKEELDNCSLAEYAEDVDWYPRAVHIGRIGFKRALKATVDPKVLEPLYLHAKECQIQNKGKAE